MTKLYGSLEAGGTKFVCAVGDENYNVIEKSQFPTTTPIETLDKCIEFFSKFENLAGLSNFSRVYVDDNHCVSWDINPNIHSNTVWNNKITIDSDVCYVYGEKIQ